MLPARIRGFLARHARTLLGKMRRDAQRRLARRRLGRNPRLLFVFGGRAQHGRGSGRELYAREPAFREAVQECERITTGTLGGPSILTQFEGDPERVRFEEEPRLVQTCVVMQLALVHLWRARGVQPGAVLGISLGEAAAVYAAGGLSLLDALRVSDCMRRICEAEPRDCAMLWIEGDFATTSRLAAASPVRLDIILVTEPRRCMAACQPAEVPAAVAFLAEQGISGQPIRSPLTWPYHTPRLTGYFPVLRRSLGGLEPQPLALPCYLGGTEGPLAAGTVLEPEYWLAMAVRPVQAWAAVEAALADGYRVWTPIGPEPFPFFRSSTWGARLRTIRLQPGQQPRLSDTVVFDEALRELESLGLRKRDG